jgi:hypothetical protein
VKENFTLGGKTFCLASRYQIYFHFFLFFFIRGQSLYFGNQVIFFSQLKNNLKINEIKLGGTKNTLYICKRNKGRKKKIKKTYFIFGGTKKLLYFYKTIKKNKL